MAESVVGQYWVIVMPGPDGKIPKENGKWKTVGHLEGAVSKKNEEHLVGQFMTPETGEVRFQAWPISPSDDPKRNRPHFNLFVLGADGDIPKDSKGRWADQEQPVWLNTTKDGKKSFYRVTIKAVTPSITLQFWRSAKPEASKGAPSTDAGATT